MDKELTRLSVGMLWGRSGMPISSTSTIGCRRSPRRFVRVFESVLRSPGASVRTILVQYSWEEEDVGKVQDCTCIREDGTTEAYDAEMWLAAEMKRFDVEIRWSTVADVDTGRTGEVRKEATRRSLFAVFGLDLDQSFWPYARLKIQFSHSIRVCVRYPLESCLPITLWLLFDVSIEIQKRLERLCVIRH